jgi:hypothetical protein
VNRLGLIARADSSGLANQSHEVWRHLHPARTLIVDLKEKNRGPFRAGLFWRSGAEAWVNSGVLTRITAAPQPSDEEIAWLVDGCNVVYTAETTTHSGLNRYCQDTGTRLVLHANPELYQSDYGDPPAEVWAATHWREDLLPAHEVVPFPVATDRFTQRDITEVHRALHVAAPAMLDRNGYQLVTAAIPHLRYALGWSPPGWATDYWQLYSDADALILPRRYAGLCLSQQEAAAAGLPIVMLESDANAHRTLPELRVPVSSSQWHPMKGGMVEVFDADPYDLARCIDRLADPSLVKSAAACSRSWAEEISWKNQLPKWRQLLGMEDE